MNCMMALTVVLCCMVTFGARAECVGDEEIKQSIADSCGFRHAEVQDQIRSQAFRFAGSDTNRFCRLMKELASENARCAHVAVLLVGEYGGASELEFLYSVAAKTNRNAKARSAALECVLMKDSPSALMLSSVRDYVCDQSVLDWSRRLLYLDLISRRKDELLQLGLNKEWRMMLVDGAASCLDKYFFYEEEIAKHSPEYMRSRERRDLVNRVAASHAVEGNVYAMTALTNALEELSRIPENEFVDFISSAAE